MPDWVIQLCTEFVLFAAAVLGWWKFFLERSDKRRAEQRERAAEEKRAQAESELETVRRRALTSSPYLIPSERRFVRMQIFAGKNGQTTFLPAGFEQSLDFARPEIPKGLEANRPVFFIVENDGAASTDGLLDIDGEQVTLEPAINAECDGLLALIYSYRPEKHGQRQTLTMSFLARDGRRDTHRYEIMHGHRWLRRVDPR